MKAFDPDHLPCTAVVRGPQVIGPRALNRRDAASGLRRRIDREGQNARGVRHELPARDVAVLDLNAWRILAQIVTGSGTEGIGISPDGRDVYTSSVNINELVRIDTAPCRWSGAR